MSKRRSTEGKRCKLCHINTRLCFCLELKSRVSTKLRFDVLRHHREQHLTSNTANLLQLSLPSITKIHTYGDKDVPLLQGKDLLIDGFRPYFLFPDDSAINLNELPLDDDRPIQLFVPDGSWRQAKKVHRRLPGMSAVPTVKIPLEMIEGKNYHLRHHQDEHTLCTFEACALALKVIEGNEDNYRPLIENLKLMNDRVIFSRTLFS